MESQILKTTTLLKEKIEDYKINSENIRKVKNVVMKKYDRGLTTENDSPIEKYLYQNNQLLKTENINEQQVDEIKSLKKEEEQNEEEEKKIKD